MTDARKTALWAVGLSLLAAWFAASGGPADDAVNGAAALARRQNAKPEPAASPIASLPPQPTPANWSAPDENSEPPPADALPDNAASTDLQADPTAIYRPPPTGPDFPPGNR